MIDISEIHMIKVIAEVGSINKAAEVLNVSQPTLSKKVGRLEQKIKLELFNRDSIGMVPTDATRFLIQESESLRTQLHNIERQLELMAGGIGGTVKVGVGPIVEQYLMPNILLDFAERDYPFKVSVVTMAVDVLFEQLMQSEIDLAVGIFSQHDVPEEFVIPLSVKDKVVAAVRQGHDLADKSSVTMEQLSHYKSVLPSTPGQVLDQIRSLEDSIELQPDITCENYAMARMIVTNTDYFTMGPDPIFHKEFLSGDLIKLDLEESVALEFLCLAKPETLKMPIVKEMVGLFSQYMDAPESD